MKKKHRFINLSEVSEELTGSKFSLKRNSLSPKFAATIDQCQEAVEGIVSNAKLTKDQEKQAKNMQI